MANPIWERYVQQQMPVWLDWVMSNHTKSHMDRMARFILSHPYYVPDEASDDDKDLFLNMLFNEKFIEKLSPKGATYWYHSPFNDFIEALNPYKSRYEDILLIQKHLIKYIWWYSRVYSFLRQRLYIYFLDKGYNIE